MSEVQLEEARIRAGRWEATLISAPETAPEVEVLHLEKRLEGVTVNATSVPERWSVSVPIPSELLSDGVQTFVVCNAADGARLGHFTIIAGEVLEDDIRAEVSLLRAELDMLKKAFRRHCLEVATK